MSPDLYDEAPVAVRMVPIERIRIVNPRERNKKKFGRMVENIAAVGLKKPITARLADDGYYELACGQGRLQAFQQLGHTEIPVVVRNITQEELLLMSIIENGARTQTSTMESIGQLAELRAAGYNNEQIARKVGLSGKHVGDLLVLFDSGEERLLHAVRAGALALRHAVIIAQNPDSEVQEALLRIQQEQSLSNVELKRLRTLISSRKIFGPKHGRWRQSKPTMTAEGIVRAVKREQDRQREALKKAELAEKRLLFSINALKTLLRDEYFVTLLRAEGLADMPQYLADAMKGR